MPPRRGGELTQQEQRFVQAMADTGDPAYALKKAGYKGERNASQVLRRPAVQQAIVETQAARLVHEILPLATQAHVNLLSNPKTPASAQVAAVKLAYDRAFPDHQDAAGKEPHEMTPDELAEAISRSVAAIEKMETIAAGKARVIEAKPDPGVFD